MFFLNTRWTQLLAPLEILMSKISLKYIYMLFGMVSIKIILAHLKTISSIFSYQTRLELQMGLASMVR